MLGDLPAQPTPLIGRDAEVSAIRRVLLDEKRRLITLTGPGGTGKTRLAIAAAVHARDLFADGVYFVDLSALRDAALVAPTIARVLDAQQETNRSAVDTVVRALRDRTVLLVLDNFEQVVEAAPLIADVLSRCPGLTVIATSRRPLELRWEMERPVPRLASPDAISLFIERARAADPALPLGKESREAIAEICERLDHLPLAIELAAARVRTVPPRLIRSQLDHRLDVGRTGPRDAPHRHRSLENAIAWSYDLLSEADRRLFRELAVFAGGFTAEAARAVIDLPADRIRDGIDFLIGCSLAVLTRREPPRFSMLETIREFAAGRLSEADPDALHRRHADYYAALAERSEPELWGPDQVERYDELEREHDNGRAALAWSIREREADLALRLVGAFWTLWFTHGYLAEGSRWMEAALALPGWTSGRHRAYAALHAGDLACARGARDAGAKLYAEASALFEELGDEHGRRLALDSQATDAMDRGDWDRAWSLFSELRDRAAEVDDREMLAKVTRSLASVARGRGDLAEAERLYEECVPLLESVGAKRHLAHTLQYVAHLAQRRGDVDRAVRLSRDSLERFQALGGIRCYGEELQDLALLAARAGRAERALRLFGAAAAVRERIDFSLTVIEQRETEEELARCRDATGSDVDRLLAEGRAMRVEDALEYAHDTLDSLGGPPPASRTGLPMPQEAALRREGDVWSIEYAGESLRLRHTKGMGYLARLLREPGREFHALDLAGARAEATAPERPTEALDATARDAYRNRLRELDEEEAEAERSGDGERAARAREEREFIAAEVAGAYGLGGRTRATGTAAERARVAVTKAIRAALDRVRETSPALGRHLEATVRTGTFCSYAPDPRAPISWRT